jgi:mono/diheme cytochrome c family protein
MTRKIRRGYIISFGIIALLLALVTTQINLSFSTERIPYLDNARVSEGRALYNENCASCHGIQLKGEPNWQQRDANGFLPAPPHDITGHTWHHPDELLFTITFSGVQALVGPDYVSKMPAFKGQLSEHQIWSILAYIKSTWPDEIKKRHDALNKQ